MINVESVLIELAETNTTIQNIAGTSFNLVSLTTSLLEDAPDNYLDLLEYAADFGLGLKGSRAIDFPGMTEEKLILFWSRPDFDTESDLSIKQQFGKAVLDFSDFDYSEIEAEHNESLLEELIEVEDPQSQTI